MSVLHRQRNCWCNENHSFEDAVFCALDQQRTVAEAVILARYEEEFREHQPGK
jgi:hypothetical protein